MPTVRLTIRQGHFTPRPFRIVSRADLAENEVEIAFADFNPSVLSLAEQDEIRTVLREVAIRVLALGFHLGQIEQTLEGLLGQERALDRSLNFALSFVTAGDLMRDTRQGGIDALLQATDSVYEVRGDAGWIPPRRQLVHVP